MNNLINIDFNKARQQADRLEALANELDNLTQNDYVSAMEQVRSGWKGEASDQFLAKGGVLENDLRGTVENMRKVVANIRDMVTKVERAQQLAQAVVRKKNT